MKRYLCGIALVLVLLPGCERCFEEYERDALRIVQAVLLEAPQCEASSGPLPLAVENQKLSHGEWDIAYRNDYVLCVEIENNGGHAVEITSKRLRFDWGEDLGFDLGPNSMPWELGVTDAHESALSLTVEQDHRWVECLDLIPDEVGERVADAPFWEVPLDVDPSHGRAFAPEFTVFLILAGRIHNGPSVRTDEFRFRVEVEQGWLASVPEPTRCCDPLLAEPCFFGQDMAHDCRIRRDEYDSLFGLDPDSELTRCCPEYPDGC